MHLPFFGLEIGLKILWMGFMEWLCVDLMLLPLKSEVKFPWMCKDFIVIFLFGQNFGEEKFEESRCFLGGS